MLLFGGRRSSNDVTVQVGGGVGGSFGGGRALKPPERSRKGFAVQINFFMCEEDEHDLTAFVASTGSVLLPAASPQFPPPVLSGPLPSPLPDHRFLAIWNRDIFTVEESELPCNRAFKPQTGRYEYSIWPVIEWMRSFAEDKKIHRGRLYLSKSYQAFRFGLAAKEYTEEMHRDFAARLKKLEALYRRLAGSIRKEFDAGEGTRERIYVGHHAQALFASAKAEHGWL